MGLREIPGRSRRDASEERNGLHQCQRKRPPAALEVVEAAPAAGVWHSSDEWHRRLSARPGLGSRNGTTRSRKDGPHIVDHIKNGEVALVVNTVGTAASHADSLSIRREALEQRLAYYTTMRGARAAVMGIEAILKKELTIRSLQEYHSRS